MSRYDYDREEEFGRRGRVYDEDLRGRGYGRDYGRGAGAYGEYDEGLARGRGYDFERGREYYGRDYRNDYATGAVGRRGERFDYDERDYGRGRGRYEEDDRSFWGAARDRLTGRDERRGASRSHLRCRDIMTRDVTVATRATTLGEVAKMMRDEDTGVIPVVEQDDATMLEAQGRAQDAPRVA